MAIEFPNTASNNQLFVYEPAVGEPRFWKYNSSQNYWASLRSYVETYTRYGTLASNTGALTFKFSQNVAITNITADLVAAPVGNTLVITINKNGSPMANVTIQASNTSSNLNYYSNLLSFTCTSNDNITVDMTNNAGTPGNTAYVRLRYINT